MTAAAQRLQAKVVEWRRDFHQHPELSNREVRMHSAVDQCAPKRQFNSSM